MKSPSVAAALCLIAVAAQAQFERREAGRWPLVIGFSKDRLGGTTGPFLALAGMAVHVGR